jgi:hypothetical protein
LVLVDAAKVLRAAVLLMCKMMHVQREDVWTLLQAGFERAHGAEERRLSGVDASSNDATKSTAPVVVLEISTAMGHVGSGDSKNEARGVSRETPAGVVDVNGGCKTCKAHEASQATSVSMWYDEGIS